MKYKTKTQEGFSLPMVVGVIGVVAILAIGGFSLQKNIASKNALVREDQEPAQATSSIDLPGLVNVLEQPAPVKNNTISPLPNAQKPLSAPVTANTAAQDAKKKTVINSATEKDKEAAKKRFLEYRTEADKIIDWNTYKTVWIKYGYRNGYNYSQSDLNKISDSVWEAAYNRLSTYEMPKIDVVEISRVRNIEPGDGKMQVMIEMTRKDNARQGYATLIYEGGAWKIVGEMWPNN